MQRLYLLKISCAISCIGSPHRTLDFVISIILCVWVRELGVCMRMSCTWAKFQGNDAPLVTNKISQCKAGRAPDFCPLILPAYFARLFCPLVIGLAGSYVNLPFLSSINMYSKVFPMRVHIGAIFLSRSTTTMQCVHSYSSSIRLPCKIDKLT